MTPSLLETTKQKNEDTLATSGTNKRAKILKHASAITITPGTDILHKPPAASATVTQLHYSQSIRGVFSTLLKTHSSNIDPGCIPLSDSTSHRSGHAPGATNMHSEQANKSGEVVKAKPKDVGNLLKSKLKGDVGLHSLFFIGQAVFNVYHTMFPLDAICKEYFPFTNNSNYPAQYDSPSGGNAKPNLIQGSLCNNQVHWADIKLITECKPTSKTSDWNLAYLQLACDACIVFAQ
ncbi:phosphoribosylformylglycinamidine synthase [Rhizoctonia solani]|uniref:Phosphoribosylformylglycinamidine synthase n=1 Tax=Rhizoctonia solani TaxID=456999 RepID=A0A8H8T1B7_9AGAM|nr:phosphoribosylformylglycinamidine synthase [Rhizoctonia solani]QRW25194.1 phosphoribosylformylglycinamidine synthase [Rhizoctonia solani]